MRKISRAVLLSCNQKYFIGLFLLLIGYVGHTQLSFGVKSGVNIATTKDLIAFSKNRVGWNAGVFATIPVSKKFFVQPELLYSTKGHRTKYQPGADSKSVTRLNYLNLPILLGYKIDKKTCFVLGPELGYLASARLQYSNTESLDVSKNYPPKFDIGLDVGISYRVVKKIGVEVRYSFGLNTLYSVDAIGNRYSDTKGANRVFQIGITYILK